MKAQRTVHMAALSRFGNALLLMILVAFHAQADSNENDALIQTAAALARGDPLKAEQLADAALSGAQLDDRDRALLLSNRALANNLIGKTEDALRDYTKAIDSRALPLTDQATALLERGLVLETLHRLDQAARDYSAVLQLTPRSATALNDRADVYRRLNKLAEAQRDYLASLDVNNLSPEHPYYGLGIIAEAQGDPTSARIYFGKALIANPEFALASEALSALNHGSPRLSSQTANRPSPAARLNSGYLTDKDPGPRLKASIGVRPVGSPLGELQLGAWRTEDEAAAGWARALKMSEGLLTNAHVSIVPAVVQHKGQYFRLRISVSGDAQQLCEALKAKGVDCVPVRG